MLAALAVAATFAPAAHAEPARAVGFLQQPASAAVIGIDLNAERVRIDVVRAGVRIATATGVFDDGDLGASADLDALHIGDVANLYGDDVLVETVTYDALPKINADACVGAVAFSGTRAPGAVIDSAGVASDDAPDTARWDALNPFTVSLPQPLTAADPVFVATTEERGTVAIVSFTVAAVGPCGSTPPPDTGAKPAPPPSNADASDDLARIAVSAEVDRAITRLRKLRLANRGSISLPFAFTEPGKVTYTLIAPGGRRVGTGSLTSLRAGRNTVAVKFSAAGRRLLARPGPLKLQLRATFTPTRAGAKTQSARRTVTLRR